MDRIKANYILKIAELGSITKAAEKLYIAQPSLSRYISNLEKELNVKLFDRSVFPIKPTKAGEILIKYIHKSEKLKEELIESLNEFNINKPTEIKIGIVPWRIPVFLPRVAPEFSKLYPNVTVTITEDVSNTLEALVEKDIIDTCIINGPIKNENLEFQVLNSEKVILVAPQNIKAVKNYYDFIHSRYLKDVVNLKDFENERFIILKNNYRLGKITREIFRYHKINPYKITEVTNMNTAMSMASVGLGVTFMPESGISLQERAVNRPLYFSIGKPDFTFPLIIAYRREKYENEMVRRFIQFVKENYKNYGTKL